MPRLSKKVAKAERSSGMEKEAITVEASVLKAVFDLYSGEDGLARRAEELGLKDMNTPSRKISVMIVGNHSAGKSSFINWYIEQHTQKVGVAVETQGFSFVTCGQRNEHVMGDATVEIFPHVRPLVGDFDGLKEHLHTQFCISQAKSFPLIDWIDTPGLVDGNVEYPFDVEGVIEALADHVDLVLVFLDPIGQALVSRTMNVVRRLHNAGHGPKTMFFMTKMDTVKKTSDLHNCLCQITQGLCMHIKTTNAFKIPTIAIPLTEDGISFANPNPGPGGAAGGGAGSGSSRDSGGSGSDSNALTELCATLDKTISQKVQMNLNLLKAHAESITARASAVLREEERLRASFSSRSRTALALSALAYCIPLLVLIVASVYFESRFPEAVTAHAAWDQYQSFARPVSGALLGLTSHLDLPRLLGLLISAFVTLLVFSKAFTYSANWLGVKSVEETKRIRTHLDAARRSLHRQQELYSKYLGEIVKEV